MVFLKKIRLKKWHKIVGIIVLFFILVLILLPSIAKWYINKYGENLIGRKVHIEKLSVNYFRCSVDIRDFTLYEQNKTDSFVSFDRLYVNFAPWHLFKREYAFTEISLEKPIISLKYNDGAFNFDDLITSSDTTAAEEPEDTTSSSVRYLIRNLNIKNGYLKYEDVNASSITELNALNISIPEIAWDNSQSEMGINFILGEKGKVALDGNINQANEKYFVHAKTENIDISPFVNYLKPYLAISTLQGWLYSDVCLDGSMSEPMKIKFSGEAGIKDTELKDNNNNHFFSAKDLYIKLDSLDIEKENYCINTVKLLDPALTLSIDKNSNTFDRILEPYYSDTLDVAADTTSSPSNLHYSIQNIIVNNFSLAFSDLSLNRPFNYDITNMNINMTGYSDVASVVKVDYDMVLNGSGTFSGSGEINPSDFKNININGTIKNLNMVDLSPYSEYYIARPVTKGSFNYDFTLKMTPTVLNNQNKIKIVNLETGKKTKDTTAYRVPVGLALYVLKDRNGIIGFDLPVSGNPSNPSFKLGKIIWKTLEEFLIKTATAPFVAIGNMFSVNPESIKQIPFELLQDSMESTQKANLDKIAEIITQKPELIFVFTQTTDAETEEQMLIVQEAKRLFVIETMGANTDSITIKNVSKSIRDNNQDFNLWLGFADSTTIKDLPALCINKIGSERAKSLLPNLMQKREASLRKYLIEKGVSANSMQFKTVDLRNLPADLKKPMFSTEITMY